MSELNLVNLFWFILGCNITAWFCLALLYFALPYFEWIYLDDELPRVRLIKGKAFYWYDKEDFYEKPIGFFINKQGFIDDCI